MSTIQEAKNNLK